MKRPFDSPKVRLFLVLWRIVWFLGLPFVALYLWRRGRADPDYSRHLTERFGHHRPRGVPHIWVHAVSLGELRSAEPLIRAYLDEGHHIVTTHLTPAGRRAANAAFGAAIEAGQLTAVWVPFDYGAAYRRFFRAFRPRFGLVMEVEIWPGMISASARQRVPLFLCNGQYPRRSFEKDAGKWVSRRDIVSGFAGVMVKNHAQAAQFVQMGQPHVAITGEMRFDMTPSPAQRAAAARLKGALGRQRIVTFASVVAGEDGLFITAIRKSGQRAVYVPRAPERFDETYDQLRAAGLRVVRRSTLLDADLVPMGDPPQDWDVLLGDSLGEMAFYLALGDFAVIGGGFVPKGSHNIIEPLALGKPVIVGPYIWTIEYPAQEALQAGVARQVLPDQLAGMLVDELPAAPIDAFLATHGGTVAKTRAALAKFGIDQS